MPDRLRTPRIHSPRSNPTLPTSAPEPANAIPEPASPPPEPTAATPAAKQDRFYASGSSVRGAPARTSAPSPR